MNFDRQTSNNIKKRIKEETDKKLRKKSKEIDQDENIKLNEIKIKTHLKKYLIRHYSLV